MRHFLLDLGKRIGDLLFHWSIAGIILAVWGLTPEDVVADLLRSAPEWIVGQAARLPFALLGLGIVIWDLLIRLRRPQVKEHNFEYTIVHNTDGTSDVEGSMTFSWSPTEYSIKVRLPRFKVPPKISLFQASGGVNEPILKVGEDYFEANISALEAQKSKRTWKWVAHGVLLNPPSSH